MVTDPSTSLVKDEGSRVYFRNLLRRARVQAFSDSEDFFDLLFAFERLGSFMCGGRKDGLADYRKALEALAQSSPLYEVKDGRHGQLGFPSLFRSVVKARNEALHQGAFARHLTAHSVKLALILEDALVSGDLRVRHFMVTNPTLAHQQQTLESVRIEILQNSFSHIPTRLDEGWKLLSEANLALYLRSGDRRQRLSESITKAASGGLLLDAAQQVTPDDQIRGLSLAKPALVFAKGQPDHPVGILTAFDIL